MEEDMGKITDFTAEKKDRFISRLAETGNITESCRFAGTTRPTVYKHKELDADFAQRWLVSEDEYIERLEAEADRRAVEGIRKKKFDKGQPVIDPETGRQYEEREYSDTLLIFRLKGTRPEKYRDNVKVEQEQTVKLLID